MNILKISTSPAHCRVVKKKEKCIADIKLFNRKQLYKISVKCCG